MFRFNSPNSGSLRRFLRQGAFAAAFVSVMLFFAACGGNGQFTPIWVEGTHPPLDGTWVSVWDEQFVIDLANNTYTTPGPWPKHGNSAIVGTALFNAGGTSGIIFIRLPSGHGLDVQPAGASYTAVRFYNLTATTANFSLAGAGDWDAGTAHTPVTATIGEARNRFTVDTISQYFAMSSATGRP